MIRPLAGFLGLAATVMPTVALAQPRPAPPPPKVIALRPAAAPKPALKYRLWPELRHGQVPGNAAVFYHRAIEVVIEKRYQLQLEALESKTPATQPRQAEETIAGWLACPLGEIPREEARKQLDVYRRALDEVELGARREGCDWEFDRRDEGYKLVMHDLQETRSLGRLVALQVRIEVLEGHTEKAIHWLKTGLVLGRHVSQGPSVIQALIGGAITSIMIGPLEDLVQAPGTPSLFWALAGLPRPFIDLTPALEGERHMLEREIPALRDLDSDPWSLERARSFADVLQREMGMLTGDWRPAAKDSGGDGMGDWGERARFASRIARSYPEAKRFLITLGRPAARVEAMPVIQVVALAALKQYEDLCGEIYKWGNIPYPRAYKGLDETASRVAAMAEKTKSGFSFVAVLPMVLRPLYLVPVRIERRLDAIQCIEAIRLHAKAHQGTLPPSLDAITEAPAPLDPATGKPFEYTVSGTTATLSAPLIPGETSREFYTIEYVLKLTE